jgi:hypothetical protein
MKTITVNGETYPINHPNLRGECSLGHGITVTFLVDNPHGLAGQERGMSTSVGLALIEQGVAEFVRA